MRALFVSDDGELRVESEWELDEVTVGRSGRLWSRLSVPKPVAAGILRLIRERDEAREQLVELEAENTRAWIAVERRAMEGKPNA